MCSLTGVFSYFMSQELIGLDICFIYLDGILIYSMSWKEHVQHLENVFSHLQAANLKIELTKCHFFM